MNGLAKMVEDCYSQLMCNTDGSTETVFGTISIMDEDYYENTVLLDYISSWQEIPHSGTTMMKVLCYVADYLRINIVLGVSPKHQRGDKDTLNKKQLVHFYRKFGFKALDKNCYSMFRKFKKL